MSTAANSLQVGTVTSTGSSFILNLNDIVPVYFEIFNFTQAASTANPGVIKKAWWQLGMADASYMGIQNTNGAATDQMTSGTSNGFTPYDLSSPPTYAAVAISSINQNAAPTVTTSAAHGLAVGDLVLLQNVTGMQQLSEYLFTVLTVGSSTTFTISVDTSGFAAAATGGTTKKVARALYTPRSRQVVGISKATQASVTTASAHGYVAGDVIRFTIPSAYGMVQLNGLLCTIVSVTSTTVFVININTSGFTTFAFPSSANYLTSKAIVVELGTTSSNVLDPEANTGYKGMLIGSAVCGANADVLYWRAFYADSLTTTLGT